MNNQIQPTPNAGGRVTLREMLAYGSGGLTDFFFLNVVLSLATAGQPTQAAISSQARFHEPNQFNAAVLLCHIAFRPAPRQLAGKWKAYVSRR